MAIDVNSHRTIRNAEAALRRLAAELKEAEAAEARADSAVEAGRTALAQCLEALKSCKDARLSLASAGCAARQSLERARRAAQPDQPAEGSIIKFETFDAGRRYAAIRNDGRWYVTGQTGPAGGHSWDDVLAQAIAETYVVVYRGEF